MFGSTYFPGVSVYNVLGKYQPSGESQAILNIGPNAEGQAANTGVFQNRIAPSANAIWMLGKHTLSFGANYSYTQLNTIDRRTGKGTIATDDFSQFVQGFVTPGSSGTGFYVSSFLQGNANRYYRANQLGTYLQDKFQITPTLSLTAGVRYDWDGGLTEKYGRIFNFDSKRYNYDVGSDTIVNPGLIIAGNNANGTGGVSSTTLTGRQWGIGPRIGAAWQPSMFHSKVVVRTGGGHLLRSRRTLHLLLSGLCHRHRDRRTFRRQPAAALREHIELPGQQPDLLPVLHSHLRRSDRSKMAPRSAPPATRPATLPIRTARRCLRRSLQSQSLGSRQLSAQRLLPSPRQAVSPSRWASTTAPTSCPTRSTTRSMCSGSLATISPSRSATSATSDATR